MVIRECIICGGKFECYPSCNRVTCSKACSNERKRRLLLKSPIKWGDEARARASQKGQTENLKLGIEAIKVSPTCGRFETNKEAKIWVLISPSKERYVVRNLKLWARENAPLFGKPKGEKSARQITSGFGAIVQTLLGNRGAPGKRDGAMTYFGWTLEGLPTKPQD